MSFQLITGNSYYIPGAVATGAVVENGRVILIDTGLDDDSGKKIMKACVELGATPFAILNTHSHADHCGGNAILQKRTVESGIQGKPILVYAPSIETSLIASPVLEPSYLYGAAPYGALRQKFIMAKPSLNVNVMPAFETDMYHGEMDVEGIALKLTYLPGHSLNMAAITTTSGVCFMGDGLFGKQLLDKHPLLFIHDYEETLKSMERVKSIDADHFVLAHGGVIGKVESLDLAEINIAVLKQTHDELYDLLEEPMTEIGLHQTYVQKKGINESIPQYYLNLSVIKAHLTSMVDDGQVEAFIENSLLLYRKKR